MALRKTSEALHGRRELHMNSLDNYIDEETKASGSVGILWTSRYGQWVMWRDAFVSQYIFRFCNTPLLQVGYMKFSHYTTKK